MWLPEWHEAQEAVGSLTPMWASGGTPASGVVAWANPGPWQLSHWTSWYATLWTLLYPAAESTLLPFSLTVWHPAQNAGALVGRAAHALECAVVSHFDWWVTWQLPQVVSLVLASK